MVEGNAHNLHRLKDRSNAIVTMLLKSMAQNSVFQCVNFSPLRIENKDFCHISYFNASRSLMKKMHRKFYDIKNFVTGGLFWATK